MIRHRAPIDPCLGDRIRRAREQKKLRQSDVGHAVGVTGSAVSMWESGRNEPGYTELIRLAKVLDRPIGYFFGSDAVGDEPAITHDYRRLPRLAQEMAEEYIQMLHRRAGHLGKFPGLESGPLAAENGAVRSTRTLVAG